MSANNLNRTNYLIPNVVQDLNTTKSVDFNQMNRNRLDNSHIGSQIGYVTKGLEELITKLDELEMVPEEEEDEDEVD